jgi:N-dimethylarginine dimethylaminohydrolase
MSIASSTQTYNGHSMVGELRKVMVCSPEAAGWNIPERLEQAKKLGFPRPPNIALAKSQHQHFCEVLQRAGAELIYLPADDTLTLDAVYAHDASLPTDFGLVLMNPGKANRVPEAHQHGSFCATLGIPVLEETQSPGKTEAGDMIWLDSRTLLIGHGYRTNPAGIAQMRALLQPHGVEVLSAPLPYGPGPAACLHLMSLISLLDEQTALVDLPWLAVETVELLSARGYHFLEIAPQERDTLAVNVLSLGRRRLVAIEENQQTNQRLRKAGFEVHTFPGSEICINGSGGPTCLTRPLLRLD